MREIDIEDLEARLPPEQRAQLTRLNRDCGFPTLVRAGDIQLEYSVRSVQVLAFTLINLIEGRDVELDKGRVNASIPPGSPKKGLDHGTA